MPPSDPGPVRVELTRAGSRETVSLAVAQEQRTALPVPAGAPGAWLRAGAEGLRVEVAAPGAAHVNGRSVEDAVPVTLGDWIAVAGAAFQVTVLEGAPSAARAAPGTGPAHRPEDSTVGVREVTVGRLPDNSLPLQSPVVSRHHARLALANGGWRIEDLGSTNGTFLNGVRVEEPVPVRPGDRIEVGGFALTWDGAQLRRLDSDAGVRISAHALGKRVRGADGGALDILSEISLAIEPGEFVAIFGGSGSGKSTLLDALSGRRPGTHGGVRYDGHDLGHAFDRYRALIGYVPQQDIVHRGIPIRRALAYAARLRLPGDTSEAEIDGLVRRTVERVGLGERIDSVVDTPTPLSGGQLKRVSLAVELVSNPSVLFLDEVTSGLDAGTDKRMMQLFAELAKDGRTVVCVTHTLENIDTCDLVALLHAGRLVWFGPPAAAREHFAIDRLSDVYELVGSSPPGIWADAYARSEWHQRFVTERLAATPAGERAAEPAAAERTGRRGHLDGPTVRTLTRRYVDLLLADRRNLALLLLQAPLVAAIIGAVFTVPEQPPAARAAAEGPVLLLLVVSAIWFGCLNSAREIVKELPVYLRERTVGLPLPAYLVSKLGPLAVIGALQCAALVAVAKGILPLSVGAPAALAALFACTLAATGMGLAVSALVDSNDKAIAAVPVLLIPQVILANRIVGLEGAPEWAARLTVIAYWGLDALEAASTEAVREILGVEAGVGGALLAVAALFAAFLGVAALGLQRKDFRG